MEAAAAVDPYELLEAVDILSKMPKDFYEKIVRTFGRLSPSGEDLQDKLSCGVCAGS